MAEPLSPEDVALVAAHLAKWPPPSCLLCASKSWTIVGVECSPSYARGVGMKLSGLTYMMPVLAVACTTCGFVIHFAWGSIKPGPPNA
jgi:hypothetical protein